MSETNKKYVKLVLLSTLAEPKALAEVSADWFGNSGRLFQPQILKEITKAEKEGILTLEKKRVYRTNIKRLLTTINVSDEVSIGKKYNQELKNFYLNLGEYTQKVYLNNQLVKVLTKSDIQKAITLDISLLLQLPFLLRYLEDKDFHFYPVFVKLMELEEYVEMLHKLEKRYIYILEEEKLVDKWVKSYERLLKLLPKLRKKGLPLFKMNTEKIKAFGK
tara:strand:- start:13509 stop:14165 length:657 start_codon:yes stop_codon:yes gene_type:complete